MKTSPYKPGLPAAFGRAALWAIMILVTSQVSGSAWAADLAGAKDHPILKRFRGSEIVAYEVKRFDACELQTSTFKRYNLETKRLEFASEPLKLEGARTQIWYESPGETSATELLRNYQNELASQGFAILYDSTKDPAAVNWTNFLAPFSDQKIKTSRSNYVFYAANQAGIRTTSAKLARPQGDVYVQVITVEWPQDDAVYKAKQGAYAAVDIIELRPMVQDMVTVSAGEMSKAIAATGLVALYGILFDFNKADIRPESRPALAEIAKLLAQEPNLKVHVVGHTDNVGGFEFNLGLSRKRAEAVVAALTREHGIAAGRLTPSGVAYLAPVAVNTTEEGRAKNRRVELVPR